MAPVIPDVAPKLEAELQQILVDVRGLVAERDGLCEKLARQKADVTPAFIKIQAERDAYEVAICSAIDDGCGCKGCEILRAALMGRTVPRG